MITHRQAQWESLRRTTFDVLILGGGVSGTCLFHHLCAEGYRVLLIDKGDFGSATSQSSAMMIWGGLLYLKDLKLRTVWRLCSARDHLLREKSDWVQPQLFRYLVARNGQRGSLLINAALSAYWLLGRCQGARPQRDPRFEIPFLRREIFRDSFLYQEAVLDTSDTRFALHWILSHQNPQSFAVNYCSASGGTFSQSAGCWSIGLQDHLFQGARSETRARLVVNCAGPWTDQVNNQFGIQSPFKHVLSKGVFLGLKRFSNHEQPLIIDIGNEGDCMSLIPWGPISLWGPTETCEDKLSDALAPSPTDIALLLRELNAVVPRPQSVEDIVSIRHGVRALVVNKDEAPCGSSLKLSRRSRIYSDSIVPWLAVYGGKLTDCVRLARALLFKIKERLGPAGNQPRAQPTTRNPRAESDYASFPGLPMPVPNVRWCVEREMCWTLEDYLRRRTNISQWIPRGGLGRKNENRTSLIRMAEDLPPLVQRHAEEAVRLYELKIINQIDQLFAAC
jgi:glycerol-3-phosphate dehydrogenase